MYGLSGRTAEVLSSFKDDRLRMAEAPAADVSALKGADDPPGDALVALLRLEARDSGFTCSLSVCFPRGRRFS
jgi:hypothetical protein